MFMPFTGQGVLAKNTEKPIKTSFIFLIRQFSMKLDGLLNNINTLNFKIKQND
jgi:hypothetical protein